MLMVVTVITKMTEGIRQLPVVAIEPNFKRSRPQEDTV